eukprot:9484190-Ditylum_brightwellii.AAC.1
MLIATETKSKFEPRALVNCMVKLRKFEKRTSGTVICDKDGNLLDPAVIEEEFHRQLEWVQVDHPNLINGSIVVSEAYRVSRSLWHVQQIRGWMMPPLTCKTGGRELRTSKGVGAMAGCETTTLRSAFLLRNCVCN